MSTPQGLTCPGCQHLAAFALADGPAFCSEDDCHVLSWNPEMSLVQLVAEMAIVEWPHLESQ